MGLNQTNWAKLAIAGVLTTTLTACDENGEFLLGQGLNQNGEPAASAAAAPQNSRTVEKDVEAPNVFSKTEAGLWDGRPSLGGVWVAHPDVKDPERVIIRNTSNGKFVVGALFRRERDIPGPRIQISSDAATALGMLAGAPSQLNVTALRREEVEVEAPQEAVEAETIDAPAEVSEGTLDPIAQAGAAIDAAPDTSASAEPATDTQVATAAPAPAPKPAPKPKPKPTSSLSKPFLQVGIFSVEANAERTARLMRNAGMVPTVRKGETGGKPFWRVIVGPAANGSERASLLAKIKAEGFTDAYAVTN